jgi:predicted nucleotidyltransferase
MFSEQDLVVHLQSAFELHSVIVYGSVARGNATETSDIDIVCFVRGAARYPKAYLWNGRLLDLWIHPVEDASSTDQFLKLHGGRTLFDTNDVGAELLRRVAEQLARPRARLEVAQQEHLHVWTWKMLDRASTPDIAGHHRRHWLLHDLPQIWCELTERHFLGPAETFTQMAVADGAAFDCLERALHPAASLPEIERAVAAVVGARRGV